MESEVQLKHSLAFNEWTLQASSRNRQPLKTYLVMLARISKLHSHYDYKSKEQYYRIMGMITFYVIALPLLVLLLALILLVGDPLSISTIGEFLSSIQPSSWITLFASLLTYYGTAILALVTIYQNRNINKIQERDLKLRETELKMKHHPQPKIWEFRAFEVDEQAWQVDPAFWDLKKCDIHLAEYGDGFFKGVLEVNNPSAVVLLIELREIEHFIRSFKTRSFNVLNPWARPFMYFGFGTSLFEHESPLTMKIEKDRINRRVQNINLSFEKEQEDPLRTDSVGPYEKAGSTQYHRKLKIDYKRYARKYLIDKERVDIAPNQPIYISYIVEQGMEVKYRNHISVKNQFDIESTQGIDVYLALIEDKLCVKVKEYDYGDYYYLWDDHKIFNHRIQENLFFDTLPNHEMDQDGIEF